ncbi:MAG: hypothetical protein M3Q26_13895, partial [Acidobacteriota bacterium]|nr:hypothetical protein [Acidobacteriota bacterium]
MNLMCPAKRLAKLSFPFLLIICLFSFNLDAQTKRAGLSKKTVTKKNEKQAKDAKKESRKDKLAAKDQKKKKD